MARLVGNRLYVLKILRRVNAAILVGVPLFGFLVGMFWRDPELSRLGTALRITFFPVLLISPFCIPFLVLNIWGLRIDPERRVRYIIEMIVLSVWIAWAVYEYITLPMLAP